MRRSASARRARCSPSCSTRACRRAHCTAGHGRCARSSRSSVLMRRLSGPTSWSPAATTPRHSAGSPRRSPGCRAPWSGCTTPRRHRARAGGSGPWSTGCSTRVTDAYYGVAHGPASLPGRRARPSAGEGRDHPQRRRPCAVRAGRGRPRSPPSSGSDREPVVGIVAALRPEKDHAMFLRADRGWSSTRSPRPSCSWSATGRSGPGSRKLVRRARASPANVVFAGVAVRRGRGARLTGRGHAQLVQRRVLPDGAAGGDGMRRARRRHRGRAACRR